MQLEFPGGVPQPEDDWLKGSGVGGDARLTLRQGNVVVDEVEYAMPAPVGFQSLEKGDPTVIVDRDQDGVDDGWYPSQALWTPGDTNDNNGLHELVGFEVIVHDPAREITVRNRALGGVGELAGLPSGKAWKRVLSGELAKIVDRVTVDGVRLEAEGHLVAGQEAWQERADGTYEYSSLAVPPVVGTWRWTDLPDGPYRLSLYGWTQEQYSVRWENSDGTTTAWSPTMTADARGQVLVGQLTIGEPSGAHPEEPPPQGTPSHTLTLYVQCLSPNGVCHLDALSLDPRLVRVGLLNVNTAARDVLLTLPEMTDPLADRIIAGRPYGDRQEKGYGVGDLLLGETLGTDEEERLAVFRRLAHLCTTRSEVFHITGVGQQIDGATVQASQRIVTVVQR